MLSLFASYVVAHDGGAAVLREVHQERSTTRQPHHADRMLGSERFNALVQPQASTSMLDALRHRPSGKRSAAPASPRSSVVLGVFLLSLALYPFLGVAFFPRTDPGQFVINVKAPPARASK